MSSLRPRGGPRVPARGICAPGLAVAALAVSVVLAGCSGQGDGQATSSGATASAGEQQGSVRVLASFYPLAHAASQVGVDHVTVETLTAPGAEPHDLELTPAQVRDLEAADLAIYLAGFQPAVDQAMSGRQASHTMDVSGPAQLVATSGESGTDPHFWLDPTRYAAVVTAVAERLAQADPGHAEDYRRRAQEYGAQLAALDQDFRTGLANCATKDLVTSHTAFGYLAKAYGLNQVGIAGVSPEQEPDPASMARVAQTVRSAKASTVYSETLVSRALAEAVAKEAGAKVAVLDPIEGLTAESAGQDYLSIMRSNLATLRAGQNCR